MSVYYNENDPYCVRWLQNLRDAGHIPRGLVDGRSIKEVRGEDTRETSHFFAGIAGWPLALSFAGWPEDRPVWTGSCPCQPFSQAGLRKGVADDRHLWPNWLELIAERRPPTIFGEQVASKDGRAWLAGVRSDLEALGYVVGAADLCAAGVGAPQIRQRLWWMAVPDGGHTSTEGLQRGGEHGQQSQDGGLAGGLADSLSTRLEGRQVKPARQERQAAQRSGGAGFWSDFDLISCADGKARRVEPGTFPLASGVSARVGKLRAYGNAIVPQLAAEFIAAYLEATRPTPR